MTMSKFVTPVFALLYKIPTFLLLLKDAFNAINCLYNGTKEWKLIDYKYEAMIYKAEESEYEIGGFSLIDVHSVDLVKYPLLKDVPWSHVIIHPGDCLFLPKSKLTLNSMA